MGVVQETYYDRAGSEGGAEDQGQAKVRERAAAEETMRVMHSLRRSETAEDY